MTGQQRRKPAAFKVSAKAAPGRTDTRKTKPARKPRAVKADNKTVITVAADDPFDLPDTIDAPPPPSRPLKRRSWLARLFFSAAGILVALAIGLWTDALIRDLFARADWLGWTAFALAGVAGLCLLVFLLREVAALFRLASITRLKARAIQAHTDDSAKQARAVIADLSSLLSSDPATAAARKSMAAMAGDIIDGRDLLELAETELLHPVDLRARRLILDSAKRVSVVTAVSPRALVDVGYVLFEAARLIRRIAQLYGGRPGMAGFIRLAGRVAGHLAVTGSIAVGDSLVQQVIGHGLAARLSSRLGEGVVNGLMTARIGIAAMDVVRPLPFRSQKRPGIGDFLSDLARFTAKREPESDAKN